MTRQLESDARATSGSRWASRRAALLLSALGVGIMLIGLLPIAPGLLAAPTLASVCSAVQRRIGRHLIAFGKVLPALVDRGTRAGISRHVGKMHPLVTLLGAVVGLRLVGAIGVLVGPMLVQCTIALVQLYEREYGLPWKSESDQFPIN